MGRYDEALADLTRAIELDPSEAWAIAAIPDVGGLFALGIALAPTPARLYRCAPHLAKGGSRSG